ncbi:unnamed protein product [Rangifer tarandus platyrhynchus]|uniref:Uncharacterized protein n=2 Tax=Rangifer tarandus platyrhynchus TaxID=3082113 RepID=A0AC59YQM3_RANTA|nr:unnamed protein product [Rangifer tarandus platyrhynchus]
MHAVLSHFSRVQLCDPMDCSPPGASVHGIFQTRILGWVAMPSFRGSSPPRDRTRVSCTGGRLFTTSTTWEAHSKVSGEDQIDKIYENALQIPPCFIKIN